VDDRGFPSSISSPSPPFLSQRENIYGVRVVVVVVVVVG
jgi:hypothetical protein